LYNQQVFDLEELKGRLKSSSYAPKEGDANYQETELTQLLSLWQSLNRQLVFLFHTIHTRNLGHRLCNNQTLAYLIEDYVQHVKHHRAQILA